MEFTILAVLNVVAIGLWSWCLATCVAAPDRNDDGPRARLS